MPNLCINNTVLDVEVLVLDKDGTLIGFHEIWGKRMEAAAKAIVSNRADETRLLNHLYRSVGYDPTRRHTLGNGPLATAPIHQLETVVAATLYRWGIPWDEASRLSMHHFTGRMSAPPATDEIKVRGKVATTLQNLHKGGVRLAVATTDNRASTEACLELIGVQSLIDVLICGDDNNSPIKPDPAVLFLLAEKFAVKIKQLAMVGDTVSDLCMAKAAGAGYVVGIMGGAAEKVELRTETNILIDSLDEIRVI